MSKIYFASDFHLGIDTRLPTLEREKQISRWLHSIVEDADELYLLGDVFDYWFEYRATVPKGFTHLFSGIRAIRNAGIPVYFFTGNHDMWMFRYFEEEFGIPILRKPIVKNLKGKHFYIGHGDGLGPGDKGYKFIKAIFANPFCQWLYSLLPGTWGLAIMKYFSMRSRYAKKGKEDFKGSEERLVKFCNHVLKEQEIDYFVFGHRHIPIDYTLDNQKSRYINLGDWMYYNSYASFDGEKLTIEFFEYEKGEIVTN